MVTGLLCSPRIRSVVAGRSTSPQRQAKRVSISIVQDFAENNIEQKIQTIRKDGINLKIK